MTELTQLPTELTELIAQELPPTTRLHFRQAVPNVGKNYRNDALKAKYSLTGELNFAQVRALENIDTHLTEQLLLDPTDIDELSSFNYSDRVKLLRLLVKEVERLSTEVQEEFLTQFFEVQDALLSQLFVTEEALPSDLAKDLLSLGEQRWVKVKIHFFSPLLNSLQLEELTLVPPYYGDPTLIITQLSSSIRESLQALIMSNLALPVFPVGMEQLSSLLAIDFSKNQLTSYTNFELASQLTWIKLSENQLTEFPPRLSEQKELEEFYMSKNQLRILDYSIFSFPVFRQLDLSHNDFGDRFKEWARDNPPENIGALRDFSYSGRYNFSYCNLSAIPAPLYFRFESGVLFERLALLDVSHNFIEEVALYTETNGQTERGNGINCSYNRIHTVTFPQEAEEEFAFAWIDLSHNRLTRFVQTEANPKIRELLNLSYNPLTTVSLVRTVPPNEEDSQFELVVIVEHTGVAE